MKSYPWKKPLENHYGVFANPLFEFLAINNGGFYFGGSLHIFHSGPEIDHLPSLEEWNSKDWVKNYNLASPSIFFAKNAIAEQFILNEEGIFLFDPETAEARFIDNSFQGWLDTIASHQEDFLACHLLKEWESRSGGKLPRTCRLRPDIPFIAGGEFDGKKMHPIEMNEAISFLSDFYRQVKDLPDGQNITFKTDEHQNN